MWSLRPDINKEDEEKLQRLAINLKDKNYRAGGSVIEMPEAMDATVPGCEEKGDLLDSSADAIERRVSQIEKELAGGGDDTWIAKYIYLMLVATLLGLALWGASLDRKPHNVNAESPPPPPPPASTSTSNSPQDVPHFLPNFTWHTILEDDNSPQAKAFAWVEEHPKFEEMPVWRIQQLMALSTIFFAKSGDMPLDTPDTSECQWKTKALATNCNEQGELQSLELFKADSNQQQKWNLPPEVSLLTAMTKLELRNEQFLEGTLPTEIGVLTALTDLTLFHNELSGSLPTELGQLTALQELVISNTKLNGALPKQLGELTTLKELHLSFNQFTGALPKWISQLKQLTVLKLGKNQFISSLPEQLGLLPALVDLSLDSNQFTGKIPTTLGGLTHLRVLQLFDNQFGGNIPTQLAKMTHLDAIFLHSNQLTGSVPSQTVLQHLPMLEAIKLHDNSLLTGSIDSSVCDKLTRLTQVSVDCTHVTCTCSQCTCAR